MSYVHFLARRSDITPTPGTNTGFICCYPMSDIDAGFDDLQAFLEINKGKPVLWKVHPEEGRDHSFVQFAVEQFQERCSGKLEFEERRESIILWIETREKILAEMSRVP